MTITLADSVIDSGVEAPLQRPCRKKELNFGLSETLRPYKDANTKPVLICVHPFYLWFIKQKSRGKMPRPYLYYY
jgi:hypothetical protein